ncbi:type III pantothenate kinase [bacterium]|nr:type III pantothenate kinase [candidate division CSSED10-310 bacterium]
MIFGLDIGNTTITAGIIHRSKVSHSWRLSTDVNRTSDEYALLIRQLINSIPDIEIEGSVVSSVVPPVLTGVVKSLKNVFGKEPFLVQPGITLSFDILYNKPQDVGADRIVNAVAAKRLYGYPLIVVDFGTATTFCVLNGNGNYCGGIIFPGINTISNALYDKAALLPRIALEKPQKVIGISTISSIQSGLFFGYLDMINGLIHRIHNEQKDITKVVATGGLAEMYFEYSELITDLEPHLTLIGLEDIVNLNMEPCPEHFVWKSL